MALKKAPKKEQIVKRVVYGNSATKLKREKHVLGGRAHTHQWTFFLKPYHKEDLSTFIRKVEFRFDKSFRDPVRTFHRPPYHVTETGWGEFDVHVRVHFRCSEANPVTFWHRLNLFPSEDNLRVDASTVVIETCDEMVFPEPTNLMRGFLESESTEEANEFRTNFDEMERRAVEGLKEASRRVEGEMEEVGRKREDLLKKIAVLESALEAHQLEKSMKDELSFIE